MYNNLFKEGSARGQYLSKEDVGKEMTVKKILINGKEPKRSMQHNNLMYIIPAENLEAEATHDIHIEWENFIMEKDMLRGGVTKEGGIFVSYFYPQIAVYDDIMGWDRHSYTGVAEFYNEFGDFNVKIEVPKNYIVWATGELQNAKDVFAPEVYERYLETKEGNKPVQIIDPKLLKKGKLTVDQEKVTYHFAANDVSDFTLGLSKNYLWEAQSIPAGPKTDRKVLAQVAYPKGKVGYEKHGLEYTVESIKGLSTSVYNTPFPFPEMTVFYGSGGMESPMMVFQGMGDKDDKLMFVTSHEIGHSYFPMYVGVDETREAWMDEGLTSMMPTALQVSIDPSYNADISKAYAFSQMAATDNDMSLATRSNFTSSAQYGNQAYTRSYIALCTLREALGEETFNKGIQQFIKTWAHKHPKMEDFLYTMEEVSGQELDWFYEPWIQSMKYPDLALGKLKQGKKNTAEIDIINKTALPLPIHLQVIYKDGNVKEMDFNPSVWKETCRYVVKLNDADQIKEIKLGNKFIPDSFPKNNSYKETH